MELSMRKEAEGSPKWTGGEKTEESKKSLEVILTLQSFVGPMSDAINTLDQTSFSPEDKAKIIDIRAEIKELYAILHREYIYGVYSPYLAPKE